MSLRDSLRSWLGIEERAITPAQLFNSGADFDAGWYSASGQAVTPETVMQAAQGACVRLLADDISSLPVDVFVKQDRASVPVPLPPWVLSPTGQPTDLFLTYVSDWVTSLGTDGNVFTLCLPSVLSCAYVEVLDPSRVSIDADGHPEDPFVMDGKRLSRNNVLHVPWVRLPGQRRGINPVQASKDSVGLEVAARKWAAAFFRNGAQLGGMVFVPAGADVDPDKLRAQFEARHRGEANWWKPGVLTGGATYSSDALKPAEADLDPLWKHVLEEAARVYHIPPHLLASQDPGAAARASVEERGIGYVRHAVRPFATRFERAHSLLLPRGFLKLNLNALMRGDAKTRAEFYNTMAQSKAMLREEIRELEDLPYLGDLGWLETPNNTVRDPRTEDVGALVRAGFEPGPSLEVVGLPDIPHIGAPPVTVQAEEARGLDSLTVAPELRIDSVAVSEAGVERIAEASTTGIATGIATLGEGIAERQDALAETFTGALERGASSVNEMAVELVELRRQVAELQERDRIRSLPSRKLIQRDVHGRIAEVRTEQGQETRRVMVDRDESGRVISVLEA